MTGKKRERREGEIKTYDKKEGRVIHKEGRGGKKKRIKKEVGTRARRDATQKREAATKRGKYRRKLSKSSRK